MRLADSYKARKELEAAIGKIKAAARELRRTDITNDAKLEIAWELGFLDLRNLEDFRCPE